MNHRPKTSAPMESSGRKRTTTTDKVEQMLVADITAGRLPPGSKLGFEMLKQRYGVGISALREALQRLVSENMVILEGHVGFRVAPFCLEDLRDIHTLRKDLTSQALRNAIEHSSAEWEGQVLASAHTLSRVPLSSAPETDEIDAWEEAHRRFHETLLSACTSRWLLHFCRTLDTQFLRYRRIILTQYWDSTEIREQIDTEHRQLVVATLTHDADRAIALLQEHYDRSATAVMEAYAKQRPNEP